MFLIVGLGNPGKEYEKTRHNTGFECIDAYAKKNNIEISKKKFDGLYGELVIKGEKVILLKPQLYMNLSGIVVQKFASFYKIPVENILVIHDDLDMVIGKYKLKTNTSSGGHNGIKNIEEQLNNRFFRRLKIGISKDCSSSIVDYVLGKFTEEENLIINKINLIATDIIDDFPSTSFEQLMNKYNQKKV